MLRIHAIFLVLTICGIVLAFLQLWFTDDYGLDDSTIPVILWWTPFIGDGEHREKCGSVRCLFTQNRRFVSDPRLEAILFYGSSVRVDDLPLPRPEHVKWGLLHEESPRNNPILVHEKALNLFNYSATFSRHSDVLLTLVDLPSAERLIGTEYFLRAEQKTKLAIEEGIAPLLYIQSDCNTASDRDSYVAELMKHVRVDSYGPCLNNRRLPRRLRDNHVEVLDSDEFLRFVARYKFTLAFENAVCEDYITEKLWRPLVVGSVPVYYGSPSFADWLPTNTSAISVSDFASPADLARFLLELASDDARYHRHLAHKLAAPSGRIANARLADALTRRAAANDFGDHVRAFQCHACERVHGGASASIVTGRHYDCPVPVSPLTGRIDRGNWWVDQWRMEKCAAELLARHVSSGGGAIDARRFDERKVRMYLDNGC